MNLKDLLEEALARFGSQTAVGERIGVDRTRVSRAMHGQHSFEVVNCLRLAHALDRSPTQVLRAAGKVDVADLLEGFYDEPTLTSSDRDLLRWWHALPESARKSLIGIMQQLAASKKAKTG